MDINIVGTGRGACGIWVWGGRTAAAFPSQTVIVIVVVCAAVLVAFGAPGEPVTVLLTAAGVLAAHRAPAGRTAAAPASPVVRRSVRRRL
ncbi:hypothetical protein [Streptomyces sp. NPDC096142]|uniref:hypothetical protein n=1 Tax=Streptomyces sp. NPDC096142 TaxID=3366077 RepID=UPI00380B0EC6